MATAEWSEVKDILDITYGNSQLDQGNLLSSADVQDEDKASRIMEIDCGSPSNFLHPPKMVKIPHRNIMGLMQISGDNKGKIGVKKLRNKRLGQLGARERKNVVRVVKNLYA